MQTLLDESTVVEQASNGVVVAFDELHRRHAPAAWSYAVAVSGDRTIAADAVADAFAMVFTAINAERITTDVDFRRFLLMATRNAVVDRLATAPAGADRVGDAVMGSAFARLPEQWRSALWLRVVEQLPLTSAVAVIKLTTDETAALSNRAAQGIAQQYLQLHTRLHPGVSCDRARPRLMAYVSGTLDADGGESLGRHLSVCAPCQQRHAALSELDERVRALAPAMPDDQRDRTAAAWTAAVTPPATGTGLSQRNERVLAVVSAAAAAATVFATAAFQFSRSASDDSAALGPIVSQVGSSLPFELPDGIRLEGLPTADGASSSSGGDADSFGAGARRSAGALGSIPGLGAVAPTTGTPDTPSTGTPDTDAPGTGTPDTETPGTDTPGTDTPDDTTPTIPVPSVPGVTDGTAPTVSVGTSLGGTPIAVEVGGSTGVTVGPITIGSAPTPTSDLITVDGALSVLDPVLAPVNKLVGGLLG